MAIQTQAAGGTLNALTGILTDPNPPANLLGMGYENTSGALGLAGQAAVSLPGTPGTGSTGLADTVSLSTLQGLPATSSVLANFQYACTSDLWNNSAGGTVWVLGLTPTSYWPVGIGLVNGVAEFVSIDVDNATYTLYGGGGPAGTARDPFAVGDVKTITDAVRDASNTWVDGDLTAYGSPALQDAGAPPAVANQYSSILVGTADVATLDEFNGQDADGITWVYRYTRRNAGSSGWTRTRKAGPVVLTDSAGFDWAVSVNTSGNLVTTQL